MKIVSSQNMPNRLLAHMRDIKHERCEVLYLMTRGGHWKMVEGFEALIDRRLRNEFTERLGEEYFASSEPVAIRAIELMETRNCYLTNCLIYQLSTIKDRN